MQKVIGYYNELEYRVEVEGNEVYQAGNSPLDSQTYTDKESGVGLKTMKEFCKQTSRDIALERQAQVEGVEYSEN